MSSIVSKLKSTLRDRFPKAVSFSGETGQVCFFGSPERAPSMADFFGGPNTTAQHSKRVPRASLAARCIAAAETGTVAIFCPGPDETGLEVLAARAVNVPVRIELKKTLPDTEDDLMAGVKNSTTREDLRRIRKAGFTYRVTSDPDDIRAFHSRFYVPLVNQQFPEDGAILSLDDMLKSKGELVCADLDGEWVAGIMNEAHGENYAMAQLGIKDADESVRRSRVVSALLVRSMQRAVELKMATTTLGFSLPFLGKGPIWFKAKWGCALAFNPKWPLMQALLDLRHAAVRDTLAASPLIHREGDALVVSAWLEPGEAPLKALAREAERYSGITKWYMLGTPQALDAAAEVLAANDRVVPIPLDLSSSEPLWLGTLGNRNT